MYRELTPRKRQSAFTLVEILIVVIILGILAAIVIPQFTRASADAQTANLKSQLQTLRAAIQLYRVQHKDTAPDLVGSNWQAFTGKTDINGTVSVNPSDWGPYMQNVPKNPLNSNATTIADTAAAGVAWVYTKSSGTIVATQDDTGTLFDENN